MNENIVASRAEKALRIINASKKYTIVDFRKYAFGFHVKIGANANGELVNQTEVTDFLNVLCNEDFAAEYHRGSFTETTLINNMYIQLTIVYPGRDIIINLSENGVQKCEIHFLN